MTPTRQEEDGVGGCTRACVYTYASPFSSFVEVSEVFYCLATLFFVLWMKKLFPQRCMPTKYRLVSWPLKEIMIILISVDVIFLSPLLKLALVVHIHCSSSNKQLHIHTSIISLVSGIHYHPLNLNCCDDHLHFLHTTKRAILYHIWG